MILIPEQVSHMREENRRIRERIPEYSNYFENKEKISGDHLKGAVISDYVTERNYKVDYTILKRNEELLTNSKFLKERTTDHIDIGTKFIVCFAHNNGIQELVLVEDSVGVARVNGFVSLNSIFGQIIRGKKENDTFSYKVPIGNNNINTITGVVKEIKKDPKDYLHYIREKEYHSRICAKERQAIHKLYQYIDVDGQALIEYRNRLALTPSQIELVKEELKYLEKSIANKNLIKSKLSALRQYISEYKIAQPPTSESIGIGTNFSFIINTPTGVINKRVEMINRAVSNELEDEYIERISPLGSKVFGLRENEEFTIRNSDGRKLKGMVYDIDNSKYPFKTNNPLVYKKIAKK